MGLKAWVDFLADDANDRIVLGGLAQRNGLVRQVGQLQHQGVAGRLRLGRLFVEPGDFLAQVLGLRFFGLGFGEFFLAHERADFLADAVAEGLERFHFGQRFAALLIPLEQFVNLRLVPGPARGEARADEIGFFADQFDVEHAEI